ncbi:MAG: 50S ribosomal protein L29 [Kiritimatiellaeota bacterium]|nr:50S ribosomal protein L29 [Kiritimatiellota bacterium]
MKARDLQQLAPDELSQRIRECAAELADLRLKNKTSGGAVDKPVRIRHLRREVARMKTLEHAGKAKQ